MSNELHILPVHPVTGLEALAVIGDRPVWPVLGGAVDDDPDQAEDTGEDQGADDDGDDQGDGDDADDQGADGGAPLGPKGEKALKAEKERRRAEAKKRRELEAELAKLKSSNSGTADDPDQIRREATEAATAKANTRLLRAEVRAVAAGKLADPKDALRFLDLDQFEVGEDGDVDADEIADAIDDLLKNKPYLAAQGGRRFQGSGDGGTRNGANKPKQITSREDLAKMSPADRLKAHQDGRLKNLLQN